MEDMNSESNSVGDWRNRSREPLENLSVDLPPPPGRNRRRLRIHRRPLPETDVPQGVANVRRRRERVGLDLICITCRRFIPKSETLDFLCHFYPPDGAQGSPLTRCYFRCPKCYDDIELGRNIGDADNFHVISGASQHFDTVLDSDASLKNVAAAYPDALLDSPNDRELGLFEHVVIGKVVIGGVVLGEQRRLIITEEGLEAVRNSFQQQ